MSSRPALASNFTHLQEHDSQLLRLGMLAERYFADDPNTCLIKLRQLAETLAQSTAAYVGFYREDQESQYDLLSRLSRQGILPREISVLFNEIRRSGNEATHALADDHSLALDMLKVAWQVTVWFHRTVKDPKFRSGPFIPPRAPLQESDTLREKLKELSQQLAANSDAKKTQQQQLESLSVELHAAQDESSFWETMATETDAESTALKARLATQQSATKDQPKATTRSLVGASKRAAQNIHLDESETRRIIDQQLRDAGWTADTENLRHAKGARPENGKDLAIAEWPTATGPADYMLFVGLVPMAVVEAKRKNVDVSSCLQQAKRYSRGFLPSEETINHEHNWGTENEFRIPFVYSTNARPYLQQLATSSGIWFCDLRRPDNLSTPLQGWHSPEGLTDLLKCDTDAAHSQLATETFSYGFTVRDYQQKAILAVEREIIAGSRTILLAMATGTGKTKTCIALIYRLLKTQRFNRILFLVDRSALGEQAANAFKDTRMESLQTFADIFGIKELDEATPETATSVHLATVQGMVARVINPSEGVLPPTVDQYDCVIVDECHRGYLLDREMDETELSFRSQDDYVSMYRRVLDYFDAIKVGLTATPALHTSEIFGPPVYTYSYREAVIDGYLIDHEPPYTIETKLSKDGIIWKKGEDVAVLKSKAAPVELFKAPDEIKIEIAQFNRKVITPPFNKVVCQYLAAELDPASRRKTLIFCANDPHADLVVQLLKKAFKNVYGTVDDDAVIKITGSADKPLKLIRRFKNELNPTIAVTVDLLTTGIDVPEICNLVFLRRVNSRILFDQMLGRATRLCDDIGKETFRIFDAVRIYEALQAITDMKPVVVNPDIDFSQMVRELTTVTDDKAITLVRDQFLAKLQRKKRHLSDSAAHDFETKAGMSPDDFAAELKAMPLNKIAEWFTQNSALGEILDRKKDDSANPVLISAHEDELTGIVRGYGHVTKPEDYLQAFSDFIKTKSNEIPALITVVTRPRSLTRKQLRDIKLALDQAGFSEANLQTAWQQTSNHEIAASIIGYIRQAALGDPLMPFTERVDHALQSILASRPWTTPQRDWLKKLAAQTKANQLVDRAALDDPDLIFKREGGGFARLDRLFAGELRTIVDQFNDALWQSPA